MIKLINISKNFISKNNSVRALDSISFEILSGEIFGIVGKSGVGKSTLLKILSLQLKADSGIYTFLNHDTSNLSSETLNQLIKQTSYIYQNFSLLYNLNVLENIMLPLKLNGMDKNTRIKLATEMLSFVGLSHKSHDYPITLSGGEAQRISIARALVTSPKVLFLDEPTSSLDEETAFEILTLIKKIHEKFKPTIILVSHQMNVVRFLCNKVLVLSEGKISHLGKIKSNLDISLNYKDLLDENI